MPNGKKQRTDFDVDGLGRVIKVTSPYSEDGETKQAVTLTYYDGNSNVIREVDANNSHLPKAEQKAFIYTYTAKDLLATETDPAGSTISYSYDAVGNQISMTDPRGNSGNYNGDFTILYEYDELARLVKGHLPTGLENTTKPVVQLEYDARGNLSKRTEPEYMIQQSMDLLMVGRTSFVIAHRLSTIKNADLILVMKDGDIVESGTHEKLLQQSGFYTELYNSQFELIA